MGKHLHELMGWDGPMTHRQYRAWQQWLQDEWQRPNKLEHYVMLVAQRVLQAGSTKPDDVKLDSQKLKFEFVSAGKTPEADPTYFEPVHPDFPWFKRMTKEDIERVQTNHFKAKIAEMKKANRSPQEHQPRVVRRVRPSGLIETWME